MRGPDRRAPRPATGATQEATKNRKRSHSTTRCPYAPCNCSGIFRHVGCLAREVIEELREVEARS